MLSTQICTGLADIAVLSANGPYGTASGQNHDPLARGAYASCTHVHFLVSPRGSYHGLYVEKYVNDSSDACLDVQL